LVKTKVFFCRFSFQTPIFFPRSETGGAVSPARGKPRAEFFPPKKTTGFFPLPGKKGPSVLPFFSCTHQRPQATRKIPLPGPPFRDFFFFQWPVLPPGRSRYTFQPWQKGDAASAAPLARPGARKIIAGSAAVPSPTTVRPVGLFLPENERRGGPIKQAPCQPPRK